MDGNSSNSPGRKSLSEQVDRRASEDDENVILQADTNLELENELQSVETEKDYILDSDMTASLAEKDSTEFELKRIRMESGDSVLGTKEMLDRQIASPTYMSSEKDSSTENLATKNDSGINEGSPVAGNVERTFHTKVKKLRKTKSSTGDVDESTEESEDDGQHREDHETKKECQPERKPGSVKRPFSPEDGSSGYETNPSGTEEKDALLQKSRSSPGPPNKGALNYIGEEQTYPEDPTPEAVEGEAKEPAVKEMEFATRNCLRNSFTSDELAPAYETYREVGNALVLKLAVFELEKLSSDNSEEPRTVYVQKEFVYPDSEDEEEETFGEEDQSDIFSFRRELHSSFRGENICSLYEEDRSVRTSLLLQKAEAHLVDLVKGCGESYEYTRPEFDYTDSEEENDLTEPYISEDKETGDEMFAGTSVAVGEQPPVSAHRLHGSIESKYLRQEYEEYKKMKTKSFSVVAELDRKSPDTSEESRSLSSRREFSCPKLREETARMQLQRTEEPDVEGPPYSHSRRDPTAEELREESEESKQIKNECSPILATVDQKHEDADQASRPLCHREEFRRQQSEENIPQYRQTMKEYEDLRNIVSSCSVETIHSNDFLMEYEEVKKVKDQCHETVAAVNAKSADGGGGSASVCDRTELHDPLPIEEEGPHQLQTTEDLGMFWPYIAQQRHRASSEELRKQHEENQKIKAECIEILEALDKKCEDADKGASSLIDKEFNYMQSRRKDEQRRRQELEYLEQRFAQDYHDSTENRDLVSKQEAIRTRPRNREDESAAVKKLLTRLQKGRAGAILGEQEDSPETGEELVQSSSDEESKLQHQLLDKENENLAKSANEVVPTTASVDHENLSDGRDPQKSVPLKVQQFRRSSCACEELYTRPFERHYLHGSFYDINLSAKYEEYRKLESEFIQRKAATTLENWTTSDDGSPGPVFGEKQRFEYDYPDHEVEQRELDSPTREQFWSRSCINTSFASDELAAVYEAYKSFEFQDVLRRASLEMQRSVANDTDGCSSFHNVKNFAYPDMDVNEESFPSLEESFLQPSRTCLNSSFVSEHLSEQYEAYRCVENERMVELLRLRLENTVVTEPNELDFFDHEGLPITSLDNKLCGTTNECSETSCDGKDGDCSDITAVSCI